MIKRNFLQVVTFYCCEINKMDSLLSLSLSFSDMIVGLFVFSVFTNWTRLFFLSLPFFSAAVGLTGGWTVCSPAGRSGQSVVSITTHWKKKDHMYYASICHCGRACYAPHAQTDNLWRRKRDVQVIIWCAEMYLETIRGEKNNITSLQCVTVLSRIFLTVLRNQLGLSITVDYIWFITKREQSRLPTDFHRRQQLLFIWTHHPSKNTVKINKTSVLLYSASNIFVASQLLLIGSRPAVTGSRFSATFLQLTDSGRNFVD